MGVLALAFAASALADYFSTIQGDGPVAYWRLGETSGTLAADSSVNDHSGSYVGGPTLGVPGGLIGDSDTAVSFTSSSQRVVVPYSAELNPTGPFSVEAIAKLAAFSACNAPSTYMRPIVVSRAETGQAGYSLRFDCSRGFVFDRQTTAGLDAVNAIQVTVTNRWYHLVGVWDGSRLRLYIDGSEAYGTINSTAPTAVNASADLEIGRCASCGGAETTFAGAIDEVAIYDYALSPTQVAAHFEATKGPRLELDPTPATMDAGSSQTLTARLSGVSPLASRTVTFSVSGTNEQSLTAVTDAEGIATVSYTPSVVGVDTITALLSVNNATVFSNPATVTVNGVSCTGSPNIGHRFPGFTMSYYLVGARTLSDTVRQARTRGRQLGAELIQNDEKCPDRVAVVLDFGVQVNRGANSWKGTQLFDRDQRFLSNLLIQRTALAYAQGFRLATVKRPGIVLRLIVGTNNANSELIGPRDPIKTRALGMYNCPDERLRAYCAGKRWGQNIEAIRDALGTTGIRKVRVAGGNDFEEGFCPDELQGLRDPDPHRVCAAAARAWVRGYRDATPFSLFVNYGDCPGCDSFPDPSPSLPVGTTWTVDDIYELSWGIGYTRPLPQIYNTSLANARGWAYMAKYAHDHGKPYPLFLGSLTQIGACQLIACSSDTRLPPDDAWIGLHDELNEPGAPDWLRQPLYYATDIAYK